MIELEVFWVFKSVEHIYFIIWFIIVALFVLYVEFFLDDHLFPLINGRYKGKNQLDVFKDRFGFKGEQDEYCMKGFYRGLEVCIFWRNQIGRMYLNVYEIKVANFKHQFRFNRVPPTFEEMKMQLDLMITANEQALKKFELIPIQKVKNQNRRVVFLVFLLLIATLIGGLLYL